MVLLAQPEVSAVPARPVHWLLVVQPVAGLREESVVHPVVRGTTDPLVASTHLPVGPSSDQADPSRVLVGPTPGSVRRCPIRRHLRVVIAVVVAEPQAAGGQVAAALAAVAPRVAVGLMAEAAQPLGAVQSIAAIVMLVVQPAVSWAMPEIAARLAKQGRPETPEQPAATGACRHPIGEAVEMRQVAPALHVGRAVAVVAVQEVAAVAEPGG